MLFASLYAAVRLLLEILVFRHRSKARLEAEVLALRHQLRVLERQVGRPRGQPTDRLVLAAISHALPRTDWQSLLPSPETLRTERSARRTTCSGTATPSSQPDSTRSYDLAGRLSDGRLDPKLLTSLPDNEIVAELTVIPGIGPWTVHGALLLLGREDLVVPGDLRVRKAVKAAYRLDHLPTQQEVLAIAAKWRPYRSLATSYLFTATFAPAKTPRAAPRRT